MLSAAVNVTNHGDPTTDAFFYGRLGEAKQDIELWDDLRIKVLIALLSEKIRYSPGGRHKWFCIKLEAICRDELASRGEEFSLAPPPPPTADPDREKALSAYF